jgi:exonuclease VII small subunit
MSAKGVWIAFGLGVSAGAKTRKQLRRGIDDGVDYLEDAAGYLKEQADYLAKEAQKTIKRARGQVDDVVDKASGAVTGAVKTVQSLM